MAHIWKTEFYCIGPDDEAFAWHDSIEDAQAELSSNPDMVRIEKVTHYIDDRETVWEPAA